MNNMNVIIADDHPIVLFGIRKSLEQIEWVNVVGEFEDSTALINNLPKLDAHVLITDLSMPGDKYGDGITLIKYIKRHFPSLSIIVLTMNNNPAILSAVLDLDTAGILVQFPFYAGIQLMMEHSGLGGLITEFFINVANKDTFPVMTFFSSALINFAVPSGGGHWVIQGPFVMPAAQALGADLGKSVMAIAYGEQWMNMAQPFWALPALAIAGLGVRDIMGYCITALLFSGVIFVIGLTLF